MEEGEIGQLEKGIIGGYRVIGAVRLAWRHCLIRYTLACPARGLGGFALCSSEVGLERERRRTSEEQYYKIYHPSRITSYDSAALIPQHRSLCTQHLPLRLDLRTKWSAVRRTTSSNLLSLRTGVGCGLKSSSEYQNSSQRPPLKAH